MRRVLLMACLFATPAAAWEYASHPNALSPHPSATIAVESATGGFAIRCADGDRFSMFDLPGISDDRTLDMLDGLRIEGVWRADDHAIERLTGKVLRTNGRTILVFPAPDRLLNQIIEARSRLIVGMLAEDRVIREESFDVQGASEMMLQFRNTCESG